MARIYAICCVIFYLTAKCGSAGLDTVSSDIRLNSVDRKIEASSQLVKITSELTFENIGKTPVKSILLAVDGSSKDKLAFISVLDGNKKDLRPTETSVKGYENVKFWRVDLKDPLNAGSKLSLVSHAVFTTALEPFPSAITQPENQYVKYFGNLYYYTPYTVVSQKTSLAVGTKNIETFTKEKPFSQSEGTINYGPYTNIAPFTQKELSIHYKNNAPFLTVKKIERLIEVSHWGNIAIEEVIEIEHTGAKLKGSFSRYEYQQQPSSGPASIKSYKTLLPAAALDVYYRDTNGNISTSNMRFRKDYVELELRPRYPLFGGWRSHYTLGYNIPSYEHLFHTGDNYLLKIMALDHIFDDMYVEELVTKVILPEGSSNIKFTAPYPVTRLPDSLHFTYLDTKGRPVITFTKKNLVENHIQDFQLRYTFPRLLMFQEPLLVVGFFYALFLLVIIYMRLDFSIHKSEHAHKD